MHNAQHNCTECQRTSNYMIAKIMERDIERDRERGREKKSVKQLGKVSITQKKNES